MRLLDGIFQRSTFVNGRGRTNVELFQGDDFDMMLAELLLGKQLGCSWEKSIPYEDKLVLLNVRKTV